MFLASNSRIKRAIIGTFLVIAFALSAASAEAKYASFVMDADTGRVLHSVNADTRNYPASLTKMMTLYMVFQAVEDGRLSMNKRLVTSRRAARQPASKLGLRAGQTITVKDAIMSLITKSANDVAVVIAENLARSERAFAKSMTRQAKRLGMSRSNFRNASGLYHSAQLSTARDMATLARALLEDFPEQYALFATKSFKYKGVRHRNHNKLLKTYNGADGIKTGYIRASGFNLVASAERDGRRVIGVVFGGKSPRHRNRHMAKLLDKGFNRINPALVAAYESKPKAGRTSSRGGSSRVTTASSRWGVQVGAYKKYSPAYKIAVRAQKLAPSYLSDGVIKVAPLKRRGRNPVYRARILGLSKKEAYRACNYLERRKIPCMELTMKKGVQLASSAD